MRTCEKPSKDKHPILRAKKLDWACEKFMEGDAKRCFPIMYCLAKQFCCVAMNLRVDQ